jgi:hypothetical protein
MISTITHIAVLIIGAILGAFIVKRFNVTDYSISGRNRAKKGGVINFKADIKPKDKQQRKIFKRKK